MGFGEAISAFFKNYVNFQGRASRAEYWWPILMFIIVYFVFVFLMSMLSSGGGNAITGIIGLIFGVFFLAMIIPMISVAIRRLHDRDMSGWWYLLSFVPLASLVLLYFFVMPGTKGPNKFGEDPLNPGAGTADVFS